MAGHTFPRVANFSRVTDFFHARKSPYLKIFLIIICSRLCLVLFALVASGSANLWPLSAPNLENVLDIFSRWDSGWYLGIIDHGYSPRESTVQPGASNYNFFPVYPVLVKLVALITGLPSIAAGVFVSTGLFIAASFLIFEYNLELGFSQNVGIGAIILMNFFPHSIVFSAVYTESCFLFFLAGAMLFLRKEYFYLSGLFAAVLSATRGNGYIFIVFAAMWIIRTRDFRQFLYPWRRPEVFIPLVAAPMGLFLWWWFCFVTTGDAFAHVTTASLGWNWSFVFPTTQLIRAFSAGGIDGIFLASGSLLLFVLAYSLLRLRLYEDFAFCATSLVFFWTLSTPYSQLRYAMVLFPLYIACSKIFQQRAWAFSLIVGVLATFNALMMLAWLNSRPVAM